MATATSIILKAVRASSRQTLQRRLRVRGLQTQMHGGWQPHLQVPACSSSQDVLGASTATRAGSAQGTPDLALPGLLLCKDQATPWTLTSTRASWSLEPCCLLAAQDIHNGLASAWARLPSCRLGGLKSVPRRGSATRNQGAHEPGLSVLSLVAQCLLLRQLLLGAILGESEARLVLGGGGGEDCREQAGGAVGQGGRGAGRGVAEGRLGRPAHPGGQGPMGK